MPDAARMSDITSHGTPLTPGPGSPDVLIGNLPAWRALPDSVPAGGLESATGTVAGLMDKPQLTPPSTTPDVASAMADFASSGGAAFAPALAANITLTAVWTSASAVPGGQPAATQAYTIGIQLAAAAAAAAAVTAIVGGATDMMICSMPHVAGIHGPGVVTKGSGTVVINNLPACRAGDKVFEASGGENAISMGEPTVLIGD